MKLRPSSAAVGVVAAAAIFQLAAFGQDQVPVRRAVPVQEPPVARAIPVEARAATDEPTVRRALAVPAEPDAIPAPTVVPSISRQPNEPEEAPDEKQLDYANGLFARKIYDLAIPE